MMQLESDLHLNDLIIALKNENKEILRQVWILRMLASRGDYELVEKRMLKLKMLVDSHFAREESKIRDVVTAFPGFSSPNNNAEVTFNKDELIDSLIREHKVISDSFKEVHNLKRFSSEVERLSCFDKFERALLSCIDQEDRDVLTLLIETIRKNRVRGIHRPRAARLLLAS